MIMRSAALLFSLLASAGLGTGAETSLQAKVAALVAEAKGTVSTACSLPGTPLNCDLHPHNHSPMQSMFKFPLALTVLHLAETGRLLAGERPLEPIDVTLARTIRFLPEDRIPHSWSPLTDRYPGANVDVPLRELIQLAVGQSDNGATDALLRVLGDGPNGHADGGLRRGPAVVEQYIHSLGITGFQLQDSEHGLHQDETAQYRNWIEPASAVQLLERLVTNSPLTPSATAFLVQTMTASTTGADRLRAGLPAGTLLAHKTGSSGEVHGKAPATNDVGLITLPDGRHLAVAVFVTDAFADEATRDRVIARIGRAAYEEALSMTVTRAATARSSRRQP